MAKVKELMGRHIYAILTIFLVFITVLFASIEGIAPKCVAALVFICAVLVGAKLAYRRWSPKGKDVFSPLL